MIFQFKNTCYFYETAPLTLFCVLVFIGCVFIPKIISHLVQSGRDANYVKSISFTWRQDENALNVCLILIILILYYPALCINNPILMTWTIVHISFLFCIWLINPGPLDERSKRGIDDRGKEKFVIWMGHLHSILALTYFTFFIVSLALIIFLDVPTGMNTVQAYSLFIVVCFCYFVLILSLFEKRWSFNKFISTSYEDLSREDKALLKAIYMGEREKDVENEWNEMQFIAYNNVGIFNHPELHLSLTKKMRNFNNLQNFFFKIRKHYSREYSWIYWTFDSSYWEVMLCLFVAITLWVIVPQGEIA